MRISKTNLVVIVACVCVLALPLTAAAQTRITDATTNGGASRDSYDPRLDGDGSRIAFRSDADLLSEGRPDNDFEIWLWDDTTGFVRITDAVANGGTGRDSYLPSIADSGTRVAFRSDADLLSEGRADGDEEIWLWDETTGLQRLSDALANGQTSRDSYEANISPDGSRVAFRSDADLLSEGRADNNFEIWLWDSTSGLQRITDATANGGASRDSYEPSLSADGSRIAFQSDADLLSEGRLGGNEEIWLWDDTTGLQRITDVLANGAASRDCYDAAISADGTRIVFRSDADFLNEGRADNNYEIWLWDQTSGLQRLTDVTANGGTSRDAYDPEISADGNLISFESDADFLNLGTADNLTEVWAYDIAAVNLAAVSTASASDRDSYDSDISADGVLIGFESDSDFLGQMIPVSQEEIWLFANPVPVELMSFSVD
jgi:Tol biopolymer transport system component